MDIRVIIWCKRPLDIRYRNEPTDSDIETLHNGEIEVHILHWKVVAIDEVVVEKLIAEQAVRSRVTIVDAVYSR